MGTLTGIIVSDDPDIRNASMDAFCRTQDLSGLLAECRELDDFRRTSQNLYHRSRAQLFLYAIHRYHLPLHTRAAGKIPYVAALAIMDRRFEEAIDLMLAAQEKEGPGSSLSSGLASGYYNLCFQTLRAQVRRSVRAIRGNQWMSRMGHPADCPLTVRPEMLRRGPGSELYPILRESTPVRMDLTHSAWSDIFFLGMDYPESARVINISVDLHVRGQGEGTPQPPVEAWIRVIDEPVLRLTSVDLGATATITSLQEMFDFGRDYLGLLKAAVIASGIVPQALEGNTRPLSELLELLVGKGRGIEAVSVVRGIPKGSRLAVSTNLLASLISVCMRFTGQIETLTGALSERDRRLVAARAILGEWIGGSGGGWQDSGGVWPGIKAMRGEAAQPDDPEYGVSRGRLLPSHHVLTGEDLAPDIIQKLQDSLVVAHGGMAQDVGPVLEMVTEKYLLRSEAEWQARGRALAIFDEILQILKTGDMRALGSATERNFFGPIQTIIPWASNLYTESLIRSVRQEMGTEFWGFWMLGGMSGGGMGFIFDPRRKASAQDRLATIMSETRRRMEKSVPFAMQPVVYDFAVNQKGTNAELLAGAGALMPAAYYDLHVPALLRMEPRSIPAARRAELAAFGEACRDSTTLSGTVRSLFDRMLPAADTKQEKGGESLSAMLEEFGFDRIQHDRIQAELKIGRLGLAQNRLLSSTLIEDVRAGDVADLRNSGFVSVGEQAIRNGEVAVVALAGGAGSRWTRGAGVVKALNPFCRLAGRHRSFLEMHAAKNRRTWEQYGTAPPYVVTTSYLTHAPIEQALAEAHNYRYPGAVMLSPGRNIGLRMVPMIRDLRFAWEELTRQRLDEQAEKVRESGRAALIAWVSAVGEGSDYQDNLPSQCLHPVGHWYEVPNMLQNGVLSALLRQRPSLRYLLLHNVDTLGANVDPTVLGYHISESAGMTVEVIARHLEDRGGGLARVDGRLRLIEGLALSSEELESTLSYYNSNTMWISVEHILEVFELTDADLQDSGKISAAVRRLASRMPTYITLKEVKKRWGKGQEDIFPVSQFEKLWGDMTALPELACRYAEVSRFRGQQLKETSQLDGWLRDGSAGYVESLCDFGDES